MATRKTRVEVKDGKASPATPAKVTVSSLQDALRKRDNDIRILLRENSQLQAENKDLAFKLRNQIARGNALSLRLKRAGIDVAEQDGVPESPTFQAAVQAYLRAHPGQNTCTKDEVRAWLSSEDRVEHPATV